jgi:hypothetical protein
LSGQASDRFYPYNKQPTVPHQYELRSLPRIG